MKFLVDEEEIEVYGFDLSSTVKTGKRQYFMYLINSPYSFHWFTFCAHVFNVWEFNPRNENHEKLLNLRRFISAPVAREPPCSGEFLWVLTGQG